MAHLGVAQSSNVPLASGGVFVGPFDEVLSFTSISVLVHSDRPSATNGLRLQWSSNGADVDDEQAFNYAGSAAALGLVIHSSVRARFLRVSYTNASLAQTFFRLQTLFHDKTPQGSIGYLGQPVTINDDTLLTKAVLAARQVDSPNNVVLPFATGDPFLITHMPPNSSVFSQRMVTAQTFFAQALDLFGIFGVNRDGFRVFNNTTRGNLYVKMGGFSASVTDFDVKVPPQHAWVMDVYANRFPAGQVNGIWDVADGAALSWEML